MAIDMPDRIRQIGGRITATSSPQSITLYTPSSASVLGTAVNYNGFMATIRVAAYIDSTPQTFAPVILPTDTLAIKEQKNQLFRSQPKKGLMIYLQPPTGSEKFEVGMIDLYNVKPIFLTGINEFFSDLEIYGIQHGWRIFAEIVNRGFGILQANSAAGQQNDWVSFSGFVTEKSSFLQGSNDAIYNYIV